MRNKERALEILEPILDRLSQYDPIQLSSEEHLGPHGREDLCDWLTEIVELAAQLHSLPIAQLPGPGLIHILTPLQNLAKLVDQIAEFQYAKHPDIEQKRNSILDQVQNTWSDAAAKILPFLGTLALDMESSQQLRDSAQKAEIEVGIVLADIRSKSREMEALLAAARDATAEVGVSEYASIFDNTREQYRKAAWGWFPLCQWKMRHLPPGN